MGRGFEQDRPKCDLHHHVRLIYRSYLASFSKLAYDLEDIGCSVKASNPPTFSVHLIQLGASWSFLGAIFGYSWLHDGISVAVLGLCCAILASMLEPRVQKWHGGVTLEWVPGGSRGPR